MTETVDLVTLSAPAGVATVLLNNPGRRNALSVLMVQQLNAALATVAADPDVRAVIVTGAGGDFCVGGDLGAERSARVVRRDSRDADQARLRAAAEACRQLHQMPKPTVAAIEGGCAGAGLALALSSDLRIVSRQAVFNTAFLSAGVSGDSGMIWYLNRLVGSARARELCLLPGKIDAETADRLGLVTRLVAPGRLMTAAVEVAGHLASSAPMAIRAMKENLNTASWAPLDGYLAGETERMLLTSWTSDADEAAAAFVAKRTPRFQNR